MAKETEHEHYYSKVGPELDAVRNFQTKKRSPAEEEEDILKSFIFCFTDLDEARGSKTTSTRKAEHKSLSTHLQGKRSTFQGVAVCAGEFGKGTSAKTVDRD